MFRSLKSACVALSVAATVFTGATVASAVFAPPAEAGVLKTLKDAAKFGGRVINKYVFKWR